MTDIPDWAVAARDHWRWRGDDRPPFAAPVEAGQESVWDYPRPPLIVADAREITIHWGDTLVVSTRGAVRVLETGHPPTFYLPMKDVVGTLLEAAPGSSMCEWKGPAHYWNLRRDDRCLEAVAWSYPRPMVGAEILADRVAFYATHLRCVVDGMPATPQAGGFYGGWITPELAGPFKGAPGSVGW